MDKSINKDQNDSDFVNFGILTNSVGVSHQSNLKIDQNINSINKRNYVKSNQDIISNPSSNLLYSKKNILSKNKNYQEDSINNTSSNNKIDVNLNENTNNLNNNNTMNSNRQASKNIFDARIFSDDDMSLNKSNKFINQNTNQNLNNNNSSNSLLLSLNINEIQLDDINNNDPDINTIKNDIKKIIPNDIFNNLNSSQNHLFTNIKEGLKKLFIYLSDSLNNQKKINGSNDYYYNNDLNSDNLLKIYIFIKNIMNNFKNQNNDIINESLFIINLILPLLPTTFISLICEQLIDIFYYKTPFEELNKNNYLLFKQILRLNQTSFFDKIFLLLKTEQNWDIKYFWKKFICDLIQKNNENFGIGFDINNNENIINILNEYHKEELINFCLNLFNYDDLNEISSNKEAVDLIKCIYQSKILSGKNNENELSFKEEILNKIKDNEDLYLIIKNIFDEIDNNKNKNLCEYENNIKEKKVPLSKIKRIKIDNRRENNEYNEFGSGEYFKGSFGDFLNNNKSNKNLNDEKEYNREGNNENNNCDNINEYEDKKIFEVMNNNIILNENNNNASNNKKKKGKKKRKIFEIDLTEDDEDNCFEKKDSNNNIEDDKEIKDNNNISTINNNLTRDNSNKLSNYNEKYSGESMVNYKYSNSINNDEKINNEQNEKMPFSFKKSLKNNTDINSEIDNNINENKFDETNNNKATINNNNNIFSSFSSFSSFKTTQKISNNENINIKENSNLTNENILNDKNNQKDQIIDNNFIKTINNNSNKEKNKIIDNNNFLDLIGNNNNKNEEIMDNNNFLNLIKNKLNINNEKYENKNKNNANENENIIDNNNILNLINNQKRNEDKNITKNNSNKKGNKFNNSSTKKKFEEENNFDFNKCINIIEKEKWSEKQSQINLLKQVLDKNLTKQNYNNSNMPIDSIINLINVKLKDKQQKLVILILEILEIIIIKLEDIFNDEYLSLLSKTIISNLNDNNIQLRYKTATVILKILSYNKKEFFINELIESLKIDKNNMRIELLTILNQYFSQNKNNNSKKINKNYFSLLVEPLILCIEDKFNKIRNLSEDLIKESTKYISVEKYYEATKRLFGKVMEEKVNCRINEIYCIDKNLNIINNDSTIKSNKSNNIIDMSKIPSTIDNANINKNKRILNLGKKNKNIIERSKSVDENKNQNIKKKNNSIYKKNIPPKNNINTILDNNNTNKKSFVDYKNVFKKNINFSENKKYRNNKDIKLGKNFITIKEKGKLSNSNSINDIKPLTQIFVNEYINNCIIPYNKNLKQILNNLNKVIINIDINFKFEFLSNLDIILEYIIRLFDFNINTINNLEWIDEYINFIDNLYEKLIVNNLKMSLLETGLVLHSLIFLSKYKKEVIQYIKKFYILISIDKTFKILFDYNDLNEIEIQKNILDLFKKEFLQGNINMMNDNFNNLKKIIKFFYKEELAQNAKNFFKEIYGIIGDKIFGEFINSLNKQDKDIFLNNIDFNIKSNNLNANKNIIKDNNDINKINFKKEKINNNNIINEINNNNNPPLIVKFNNKKNNISNIPNNNNKVKKINSTFMKKDLLDTINEDNNIMPKDNFERNRKFELDLENEKNDRKNSNNSNLKIMKNNTENNINFKNKIDENKIEVTNINEIKELLNDLSAYNEQINIEQLDNDININNILSNKQKLISILKDLFNSLNFNCNKNVLIESIELILDSLSNEINYFFNVNTMNNKCPKNIETYIIEIIDIFSIISSKKEIIITLTENILNKLLILFLNYLEIDKEENISDINQDFNLMFKKINKISLNIIQKSNREIIIIVLIRLISNFKEESDIAVLGINCLVKLIKITDFKNINSVKILAELIIALNDEDMLLGISNNKTNELFLKSIKKLLNQMVIEKKYNILKDYQMAVNLCNIQDEKICDWIQKILEHNKF